MKKVLMVIFIGAIGFGLVLGDLSWICAQEVDTGEFTLEEITVTAQKREENQQKVAVSMDVVSGDEIRELGYSNLEEILSSISSAFINKAGDGLRVSIRGMSDDIRPTGTLGDFSVSTPTVAVNMDGVYTSRRESGVGLYDVERVEVLFGPQSTLYSTASPGGIVNVVTGEPKTDQYEASGSLKYGNYNTLQTEGMINAPVSEHFALRGAFSTSVRDGYMTNGANDEDVKSARLKALFKPNDKLSFLVTAEYRRTGGNGQSMIGQFIKQSDLDNPWDNSNVQGPGGGTPTPRNSNQKKLTGNFNADLGFSTLTLVPSFLKDFQAATMTRTSPDGTTSTSHSTRRGREEGLEMRIASSYDAFLKWIVGGNYYKSRNKDLRVPETGEENYYTNDQDSKAVFGNITYPVTDKFRLTGGLRYTTDTNDIVETHPEHPDNPYLETKTDYSGVNHKVGIEYDLGTSSMFYADQTTTYRSVGMQWKTLDPELLDAYTLGVKNRFFENKLQLNISSYYYDYRNFVADFGMMADPENYNRNDEGTPTNATLRKIGLDVQANAILSKKDRLNFEISYLSSKFTKLKFDFVNPKFPDLDFTGQPDTVSPKFTISLNYSHNFILPNGGTLTARIDSRYQTEYLVQYIPVYQRMDMGPTGMVAYFEFVDRSPYIHQEAHHISNASMIYAHPDGKWTLSGYVNNIENYAEKKFMMMNSIMIGDPRTFGAVLTVRY